MNIRTDITHIWFHGFFLLLFIVLIGVPLYSAISNTPPTMYFTKPQGLIPDYYYYLSVIHQGRTGFSEINQYTLESLRPNYIHVFYLFLGRIGTLTGLNDIVLYHLSMYGSLVFVYIGSFMLVSLTIPKQYRLLAMILIFFISPWPPLTISIFGKEIMIGSVWWARSTVLERIIRVPHHQFARALVIFTIILMIAYFRNPKKILLPLTLILSTIGIVTYAVPFIIFAVSVGIYTCWYGLTHIHSLRHSRVKSIITGGTLISAVSIMVIWIVSKQFVSLGTTRGDNFVISEYESYAREVYPYQLTVFIMQYLFSLPFIGLAIIRIIRHKKTELFFLCLLFFVPFGLYILSALGVLPINKLRWVYGGQFILSGILMTYGMAYIFTFFKRVSYKMIAVTFVAILISINIVSGFIVYWLPELSKQDLKNNSYIPLTEFTVIQYLNYHSVPYTSVLAPYYIAVYLPAFTHNRVYLGHESSTINFKSKWWYNEQFLQGLMKPQEAWDFLHQNHIDYVIWDSSEPSTYLQFLERIYTGGKLILYKVNRD